jgi:hypothetical protein
VLWVLVMRVERRIGRRVGGGKGQVDTSISAILFFEALEKQINQLLEAGDFGL